MICFRCEKEEEQMMVIDNKELNFKETVCFPCIVRCLKDHKKEQAEKLMRQVLSASDGMDRK
jgi:hypothetical protein